MFTDNMTIVVLTSVSGHQRDRGWISLDARRVAMYRDCGTAAWEVNQGYGLVSALPREG